MATTWHAIRDAYASAIVALAPTDLGGPGRTFRRCPLRFELRPWALREKGSQVFRTFELVRRGDAVNAGHLASDEERIMEPVELTVAYPVLPADYGDEEIDDLEKLVRADAQQLKDTLFSPGNYRSGQSTQRVTILALDRGDTNVWFQSIRLELVYVVAQDLSF